MFRVNGKISNKIKYELGLKVDQSGKSHKITRKFGGKVK